MMRQRVVRAALVGAVLAGLAAPAGAQGKGRDTTYVAAGRRPNWSVVVRRDSILVATPNERGTFALVTQAPKVEKGARIWHSLGGDHSINLSVVKGTCTTGGGVVEYPEQVVATIDGLKVTGCGNLALKEVAAKAAADTVSKRPAKRGASPNPGAAAPGKKP